MLLIRAAVVAAFILLLAGCTSSGQQASEQLSAQQEQSAVPIFEFEEGTHYAVLASPLPDLAPVVEFFYFGCRSCYQLIPELSQWSRRSGNNIALVPAHTETKLVDGARLFHTFVEMGVLDKMYELGFVIYQTEESELYGKARIDDFLNRHQVDTQRFWDTWSSEAVNRRLATSQQLTRLAGVVKTPTFVVNGRYRVETDTIKSMDELYALLTYLADKKI